jgi:hypothetical protein
VHDVHKGKFSKMKLAFKVIILCHSCIDGPFNEDALKMQYG